MARKNDILEIYAKEVENIREAGLFKGEAPFVSPQGARVKMEDGRELLCMCANNYLGLGNNPRLIEAAKRTYYEKGYGLASVRFICVETLPLPHRKTRRRRRRQWGLRGCKQGEEQEGPGWPVL